MNKRAKLIGAGLGATVVIGVVYLLFFAGTESTDDAQVGGHVAILSAKVPGLITEVLVDENYKVKKGDVLAKIDQRDYLNVRDQLQSELTSAEARYLQAQKDFKRNHNLLKEHAIPDQEMDASQSQYDEMKAKVEGIRSQLKQAELNLDFTSIRAPADGTIGKKAAEPGMVVSTTQPLMSFVSAHDAWVTANFKETQVRNMRISNRVKISIDSIGGKEFEGTIESFSPATGSTFALIPPDNATGNFTKIVQRVPVRVRFNPQSMQGYEERIVPGLSADVKVYLR
jgi:membrane fusion protein (multidrug efflux system)